MLIHKISFSVTSWQIHPELLEPKETGSVKSSFQGFKGLKKLATFIFACFLCVIWLKKRGNSRDFFSKKVTPSNICCLHVCLHDHKTTILEEKSV